IQKHKNDPCILTDSIKSLRSLRCISTFSSMRRNKIVSESVYYEVLVRLSSCFLTKQVEDIDLSLAIAKLVLIEKTLLIKCKNLIKEWGQDVIKRLDEVCNHHDLRDVVVWLIRNK